MTYNSQHELKQNLMYYKAHSILLKHNIMAGLCLAYKLNFSPLCPPKPPSAWPRTPGATAIPQSVPHSLPVHLVYLLPLWRHVEPGRCPRGTFLPSLTRAALSLQRTSIFTFNGPNARPLLSNINAWRRAGPDIRRQALRSMPQQRRPARLHRVHRIRQQVREMPASRSNLMAAATASSNMAQAAR